MFRKLKEFHRRTMEAYQKGLDEEMEPWKKRLKDIHANAHFLFYVEQMEFGQEKGHCIIRGELVRGNLAVEDSFFLLDSQGEFFAMGILLREISEEREESKKFAKKKREELSIKISQIKEFTMEEIDLESYDRLMKIMARRISFLVNEESLQADDE